ncbi:16S rRNA processing protein rimM [Streptococcus pyogenes MGAS2096]|nr:16S rRNA processing protein rimM [Streptococcus pyogenes MGAS2096]
MEYFNVGKIVNTQGLQGEMRVLSVSDFAEERFKKGSQLALFDDKDRFVQEVTIVSHRKQSILISSNLKTCIILMLLKSTRDTL